VQVTDRHVLPIVAPARKTKARVITKEEKERSVVTIIRKARMDAKMWGQRERRAKEKAEKGTKKKDDTADE